MTISATSQDSLTPKSATARAIYDLVETSPFDALHRLMHELAQFNVKISISSFPAESKDIIFSVLDDMFKLAVTIPQDDPLAFYAYTAFVLSPRLILISLPPSCKGKHESLAFKIRCDMLMDGRVSDFINGAHDS